MCILSPSQRFVLGTERRRSPKQARREKSRTEPSSHWGLWSGSFCPMLLSPPPGVPVLCSPSAASPTLTWALTAPTSLSPDSATHPVLVGIDRGITNSPSKPGHIPRLQRGEHHQEPHHTAPDLGHISTLLAKPASTSFNPNCLPLLPPPTLAWSGTSLTQQPQS